MNLMKWNRSIGLDYYAFTDENRHGDWYGVKQRIMPRFDINIAKKLSINSGFLITNYICTFKKEYQYLFTDIDIGAKYDFFQFWTPFPFFGQFQTLYGDYALIAKTSEHANLNLVHVKIRPAIGINYYPHFIKNVSACVYYFRNIPLYKNDCFMHFGQLLFGIKYHHK
jgi:hypothetical protein